MTINQEAPVVQAGEINIKAKPQLVWKVLTDVDNWPNWNTNIKDTVIKEEANLEVSFSWKTNGSRIKSKIHSFETDKALGWAGVTFGAKAIHNWYLEPISEGTCVRVKESMEGWIVLLMKKKMNTLVKKDMMYWLEQLKIECEN